jgi:hypothetical protein
MPKNNCNVGTILTHTAQTNQAFQPKKGQLKQGRSPQIHKSPTAQISPTTQKRDRHNQHWENSPTTGGQKP